MNRRSWMAVFSRILVLVTLSWAAMIVELPASASEAGEAGYWTIPTIRDRAKEGDYVTAQGRVVRVSKSRFFTIEDDTIEQMIVVIPDFLQREFGSPKRGETIRVHGKFDHKTLLDSKKTSQGQPRKTWGIRVARLQRNIETAGTNPNPDSGPSAASKARREGAAEPAPAAPVGVVTLATPNMSEALKNRLVTARKRALAAREDLASANAAVARAQYEEVPEAQQSALAEKQQWAQQDYDQALAEIGPLVEEGRRAGLDPTLIELYEAGLTKPQR